MRTAAVLLALLLCGCSSWVHAGVVRAFPEGSAPVQQTILDLRGAETFERGRLRAVCAGTSRSEVARFVDAIEAMRPSVEAAVGELAPLALVGIPAPAGSIRIVAEPIEPPGPAWIAAIGGEPDPLEAARAVRAWARITMAEALSTLVAQATSEQGESFDRGWIGIADGLAEAAAIAADATGALASDRERTLGLLDRTKWSAFDLGSGLLVSPNGETLAAGRLTKAALQGLVVERALAGKPSPGALRGLWSALRARLAREPLGAFLASLGWATEPARIPLADLLGR